MSNISMLLNGFLVVLTFQNVSICLLGAILGLIVGAMPGIGSLAGVALLLPLTYKFNPTSAIILLGSLYYSNMFGGSFSAILLNIPGDSPAVMTMLDGYPMAKKGRPGQALFCANISSFIGGAIGMLILTFLGPGMASFGLHFGPQDMTALLLVAMTSIGYLVGKNPIEGIIMTLVGILISSIGMDPQSGAPRYNFNNMYLMGGIPFVPFVIGTVGFSQVLRLMSERNDRVDDEILKQRLTIKGSLLSRHDFRRMLPFAVRSGVLGTFVGVLPGAGATTGAFLGYAINRAFKSEEPFGSGAIEGIASCEAANNAAAAGAFAPLLALGIPGSGTGAVLLGGLMMWGLSPGPLLFRNNPEFAWGLIASLFFANLIALVIAIGLIPFLIKILTVPVKIIIPVVTVICFVGSYANTYSMYGVVVMFISGIVSYICEKSGYSTAPMILSFVLAPLLESNMRKALITSQGSLSIFFTSPIACTFIIILFIIISFMIIRYFSRSSKTTMEGGK